jgi:hypothetical protein
MSEFQALIAGYEKLEGVMEDRIRLEAGDILDEIRFHTGAWIDEEAEAVVCPAALWMALDPDEQKEWGRKRVGRPVNDDGEEKNGET